MRRLLFFIILMFCGFTALAQQEFHVFPDNHKNTPGTAQGNGSLEKPWDLQTALNQKPEMINGGDTLWIHQGIYNGRFISNLKSNISGKAILVSAFQDDKVVLNGNVESNREMVLEVRGGNVIYQNFEVTWLGEFSRNEADPNFRKGGGIHHLTGENVKFYNLKVHDNPSLGFGFWKHGAGSIIENCMIYNNGYIAKNGKGRGEGIYVQNKSDEMRYIKNNIIYNNYYKGIEVWSAGKNADFEYVKNITVQGNIIFNNGNPAGRYYDNIIVASADRNGINIAKNIKLLDNVLYHNLNVNNRMLGDGPSLTLGFNKKAPITDILVENNIILGRSDGLRILHANGLTFKNNLIHTGFVHMSSANPDYIHNWKFENNSYFVKSPTPFRMIKLKNNTVADWRNNYGLDIKSSFANSNELQLPQILKISQSEIDPNKFQLALYSKDEKDLDIDFSKYKIPKGTIYRIIDVENPNEIISEGIMDSSNKIKILMQNKSFQKPSHNERAVKTPETFGVFTVEFGTSQSNTDSSKKGLIQRLKERLGI